MYENLLLLIRLALKILKVKKGSRLSKVQIDKFVTVVTSNKGTPNKAI